MHRQSPEFRHSAPLSDGLPSRPSLGGPPGHTPEAGGAPRLLLPGNSDARRDSIRTTTAFVAFVLLFFVFLNVVIFNSARSRLVGERWTQLRASTEETRLDLDVAVDNLRREARFVAGETVVRNAIADAVAAPEGRDPTARSLGYERKLDEIASSFDLLGVELVGSDGSVVANSTNASLWRTPEALALARAVAVNHAPSAITGHALAHGKAMILVAAPIAAADGVRGRAVALIYAGLEQQLGRSLTGSTINGSTAGAFVVLRDRDEVLIASQPPVGLGLYLGQRLALTSPTARAVALAALGSESEVETRDAAGEAIWSVTRPLNQLGCGLVGVVDRSTMLAGLRMTLLGLLLLDVGAALLTLAIVSLWRRQLRVQVEDREMALTRGHADRLQSVLDSAFDAILSLDAQGRVLTANRAAARLFGRSLAELTGQPVSALLGGAGGALPGDGAPESARVSRSTVLRPEGSSVPVEFTLARSSDDASGLHTLVVRDINERVEAEQKVMAFAEGLEFSYRRLEEMNRQLELASRLKSEFLANTSHELRTPLNGIMGFLQLVQDGLCESREEQREFLDQALHCSKHLLGLINDVLDIAKIEAGRLSLQIEAVDLPAVFDEVYTITHVQAQQKGLTLEFELPAGNVPVRGDFGKIKQVLVNLVGNALKFTPAGSITVRAVAREPVGHMQIEVIDTGIGIPADRQRLIFEKFIQADGTTTRQYGGTGLGLAITRSLIELMGGVIDAQSDGPGHGTRMIFSLPLWRGEEDLPTPSDAPSAPLPDIIHGTPGGALVLVVDDDRAYRQMITALLHRNGYRTAEAAHAEAGWVLVRRLRPALVLLDYALSCPEGALLRTGWDLADRMSSDDRIRQIPILFVTGHDAHLREKWSGLSAGRTLQHLQKPVLGTELLRAIAERLGDAPDSMIRVLLADDDPMVAAYVTKVLPPARFQLDVVNNGEECLHLLRTQSQSFDLLLLDLLMPEVNGYEVLREMAVHGTGKPVPVIVLATDAEPHNEEERRLLEQGLVLEVISKAEIHARPDRLGKAIGNHLDAIATLGAKEPPRLEIERFRVEVPEGEVSTRPSRLAVEHRFDEGVDPGQDRPTGSDPPGRENDESWRAA